MDTEIKVQELDPPTQELLRGLFKGHSGFARFGNTGFLLSATYKEDAAAVRNFAVRPDDVWINTFPRSGTTLTQELVWLLKTDFDYDGAAKRPLLDRYLQLGIKQIGNLDLVKLINKERPEEVNKLVTPSSRFIKAHLPLSLLPADLLDTAKLVYVARDPRDVAVSYYLFLKLLKNYVGDFKTFWKIFTDDLVSYSPYYSHVKEAWSLRDHPNLLFIFYEDIVKDLPSVIRRLSKFLDKEVTDEQITRLCKHLEINNFKKNESVNPVKLFQALGKPDAEGFIRKGEPGSWREWFDDELSAHAQTWIRDNLAGTDLSFPGSS